MTHMATTPDVAAESPTDAWARRVRAQFPMFADTEQEPLVYLDNGATTQKPQSMIDAMSRFYAHDNSNTGRGVYRLSMLVGEIYERCRETVARFVNAESPNEIVFTRNTTDSVNLVAQGFGDLVVGEGDEVLITGMEHHSNLLPWLMLCERRGARLQVVPVDASGSVPLDEVAALLSDRTRMVAITHISNVLGTVNPIRDMVALAKQRDIPVLVDGAQAVARRQVDVVDLGADFYCFSAHKMYGPMGVGVLYAKDEHLQRMRPTQLGGGTVRNVTYEGETFMMPAPGRFEPGTPNIAGAVGLAAAVDFLSEQGWDTISGHDAELVRATVSGLESIDGVRVMGRPADEPGGIVSFVVEGLHPYDVGNHLNDHGIAVRTGVHCAVPFLDSLELVGTVRVSFGVYNTAEEVERLLAAVATVQPGMWTREHPTRRFL